MFENRNQEKDYCELIDTIREVAGQAPCEQWPDAFHPHRGESDIVKYAKALCAECPVKALCAAYGVKWENEGIYGGLTPYERGLIRTRAAAAGSIVPRGMLKRKPQIRGAHQTTN